MKAYVVVLARNVVGVRPYGQVQVFPGSLEDYVSKQERGFEFTTSDLDRTFRDWKTMTNVPVYAQFETTGLRIVIWPTGEVETFSLEHWPNAKRWLTAHGYECVFYVTRSRRGNWVEHSVSDLPLRSEDGNRDQEVEVSSKEEETSFNPNPFKGETGPLFREDPPQAAEIGHRRSFQWIVNELLDVVRIDKLLIRRIVGEEAPFWTIHVLSSRKATPTVSTWELFTFEIDGIDFHGYSDPERCTAKYEAADSEDEHFIEKAVLVCFPEKPALAYLELAVKSSLL